MENYRKQLSPPKVCDYCKGSNMGLTSNNVVYGELKGEWPYCYYCDDCGAMVGCHPNTYNPLGIMATSKMRRHRAKLHALFDPIWKERYLSRSDAYKWLAKELNIVNTDDCHIGMLSNMQLGIAIKKLTVHQANGYQQFIRRKEKTDERRIEQRKRASAESFRKKLNRPRNPRDKKSSC